MKRNSPHLTAVVDTDFFPTNQYSLNSPRHIIVDVQAPESEDAEAIRSPVNIAIVIDASGSMSRERLRYAKDAAEMLVESLREDDVVSILSFSDDVQTHIAGIFLDPDGKLSAKEAIRSLQTRGCTDLASGWLEGAECVAKAMEESPGATKRVLVLSDGHANQGIQEPAKLQEIASGLRTRGIVSSAIGIGDGYSTTQLEAIANYGGGSLHDAQFGNEIEEVVAGELQEIEKAYCEDSEVVITAPDGFTFSQLGSSPEKVRDVHCVFRLGALFPLRRRSLVLRVNSPNTREGDEITFTIALRWKVSGGEWLDGSEAKISLRFSDDAADPLGGELMLVRTRVAKRWQACTLKRAAELNGDSRFTDAEGLLSRTIRELTNYCGSIPECRPIIEELRNSIETLNRPMEERSRKEIFLLQSKMIKAEPDYRRMKRENGQSFPSTTTGGVAERFPIREVDGRLIAEISGFQVLLDTSSPVSIGAQPSIEFGGNNWPLSSDHLGLSAEELGANINCHIDALIGTDILSKIVFTVDLANEQALWINRLPQGGEDERVSVWQFMGAPVVSASLNGTDCSLFLDTGARVSYLRTSLHDKRFSTDRIEEDFHPMIGTFSTKISRMELSIAHETVECDFGTPPPMIDHLLGSAGVDGALGTQFFEQFTVTFNLAEKHVLLESVRNPSVL